MMTCGIPVVLAAAFYSLAPLEQATVSSVGETATRNPAAVVSAKVSDVSPGTLKRSAFALTFARPADLGRLAVLRTGWDDWAIPKRLAVSVNGGGEQSFDLVSPRVMPNTTARRFNVDRLPLIGASAVTSLVVRVDEIETKVNQHGALKLFLAEGPIVTCLLKGNVAPLGRGGAPSPTAGRSDVKVTVTASAPVKNAELAATIYRFRKNVRFVRRLPPLSAGTTTLELSWREFVCAENPALVLDPVNVAELELKVLGRRRGADPTEATEECDPELSLAAECSGTADDGSTLLDLQPCDAPADAEGWRTAIPSDGFGRFGWQEDGNGLLACTVEENSFFCTVRGRRRSADPTEDGQGNFMRWYFGNGGKQSCVWRRSTACSTTLFTDRLMRFEGTTGKEVVSKAFGVFDASRLPERRIAGIMAPGFLLDSHDRVFTLAPEMARGKLYLLMPTAQGLQWMSGESIDLPTLSEGWAVLVCEKMAAIPVVVAFERRPLRAVREGRGYGFVFPDERGRIGVAPVCGYEGWKGTPGPVNDTGRVGAPSPTAAPLGRVGAPSPTEELAAAARRQAELLRNYPIRCDMRFRIEGDEIAFEERPAFLRWTNAWGESGTPCVPCPPLIAFASDLGYPVSFPDGRPTRLAADTRFGPYRGWSSDTVSAARYRLRKGFKDLTLYPRPAKSAQADHVAAAMLEHFRDRPGPGARTDALEG